ncbi:MAG: hypothetical protein J7K81_06705 [Methanophagales archaeon]|nr:hypothetical protein [Methanophagales archaeon]
MDMDNPSWINEALVYFGGDEMKAIELKILIKNGVKMGSELIPPDIGLKNLREYWKHFFFLEKRKPVLKEK